MRLQLKILFGIKALSHSQEKLEILLEEWHPPPPPPAIRGLRISYTIVIPKRNVPAVKTGLLHGSIIAVKLEKQIGNNTAVLSVQDL